MAAAQSSPSQFGELGLEPRLLRSLAKKGFSAPTPVQAEAIPHALAGRDLVARARTGSGKTLAYLLPALHVVLKSKKVDSWQGLVLVPTRELCEQVKAEARSVALYCGKDIRCTALGAERTQSAMAAAIANVGQLVVATPGRIAAALQDGTLPGERLTATLSFLVLDEADLLLSYGYEQDIARVAPFVPRSCQCMLMSATAGEDIARLQKLVLHNPIFLDLGAATGADAGDGLPGGTSSTLSHWSLNCAKPDRIIYLMTLLKLGLIRKKILAFVNSIDSAYRCRLVLEAFGIKAVVLHAELPVNSRAHILAQFNKGLYDYLIAADDVHAESGGRKPGKRLKTGGPPAKRPSRKDEEFGVTRGIDFKGVRTVVNVELPASVAGYVHRSGRAGRAGVKGFCLTLFTPEDAAFRADLEAHLSGEAGPSSGAIPPQPPPQAGSDSDAEDAEDDDEALEGPAGAAEATPALRPYNRLTAATVDRLRYRAEEMMRRASGLAVREARARDLRIELLNSSKLREQFEDRASELELLKHDKSLVKTEMPAHLKQIPTYLRDVGVMRGKKSAAGVMGRGRLTKQKKRKLIAATDPVKAMQMGQEAPTAAGAGDQLTDMEKRAEKEGKRALKAKAKADRAINTMGGNSDNVRRGKRKRVR